MFQEHECTLLLHLCNLSWESPNHIMALAAISFKFAALTLVILCLHRLSQYLFGRRDKPPIVPYWLPFVGSAITYGRDPQAFFFRSREKVNVIRPDLSVVANRLSSTAMSSPSCFLARRWLSILVLKAMILSLMGDCRMSMLRKFMWTWQRRCLGLLFVIVQTRYWWSRRRSEIPILFWFIAMYWSLVFSSSNSETPQKFYSRMSRSSKPNSMILLHIQKLSRLRRIFLCDSHYGRAYNIHGLTNFTRKGSTSKVQLKFCWPIPWPWYGIHAY